MIEQVSVESLHWTFVVLQFVNGACICLEHICDRIGRTVDSNNPSCLLLVSIVDKEYFVSYLQDLLSPVVIIWVRKTESRSEDMGALAVNRSYPYI